MTQGTNGLAEQLIRAALARLEADRQEAIATIQLYLNSSVGIGDHPNVVTELINATERLSAAEDSLASLRGNFLTPLQEPVKNE